MKFSGEVGGAADLDVRWSFDSSPAGGIQPAHRPEIGAL